MAMVPIRRSPSLWRGLYRVARRPAHSDDRGRGREGACIELNDYGLAGRRRRDLRGIDRVAGRTGEQRLGEGRGVCVRAGASAGADQPYAAAGLGKTLPDSHYDRRFAGERLRGDDLQAAH
jgi:hypothetical protein